MNPLLLAIGSSLTVGVPYAIIAILVGLVAFYVVRCGAADKEKLDGEKEKINRAAGGAAWIAGLPTLADLLYAIGAGEVKKVFEMGKKFFEKYFLTARGPLTMAFDVFTASWPSLHKDDVYGDLVIEEVVENGLGLKMSDDYDVALIQKAGVLSKVWPDVSNLIITVAARHFRQIGPAIRSLTDRIMAPDGEVKIMIDVGENCWNELKTSDVKGAKELVDKLATARALELGWTPPAAKAAAA